MDEWDELWTRLHKTVSELKAMAADVRALGDGFDEARAQRRSHLLSKAEGVDLAIDYMRGYKK